MQAVPIVSAPEICIISTGFKNVKNKYSFLPLRHFFLSVVGKNPDLHVHDPVRHSASGLRLRHC